MVKKYNGINLIKYFMAICVIAIHMQPLLKINNNIILNLYDSIVKLAVPFFFIVTGFFIGKKIPNLNQFSSDSSNILKKNIQKFLRLYLIFTIIYMPLTIYEYITLDSSILDCLYYFLRGLIFVGEHYNSWALWYLLSAFYGLCVIYFLHKKGIKIKNILYVGIFLFLIGLGVDYILRISTPIGLFKNIQQILHYIFGFNIDSGRIFTSVLYLSVGMLLSKMELKKLKKNYLVMLLIISIIVNTFINKFIFDQLLIIASSILLFLISLKIELKDNTIYDYCKLASTDMYFWHLFIWSIFCFIFYKQMTYGLKIFIIIALLTNILSIAHFYLLKKRNKSI